MTSKKRTLVIGGSAKPERYSNRAIRLLLRHGYPVVSTGSREAEVNGVNILTGFPEFNDIHTVTMYVAPVHQPPLYDYILGLNPKRIIFNPGTENEEFIDLARKNNIGTVQNCTLVMLNAGMF